MPYQVGAKVIELWTGNYKSIMSDEERMELPWVISFCGDGGGKGASVQRSRSSNTLFTPSECESENDIDTSVRGWNPEIRYVANKV